MRESRTAEKVKAYLLENSKVPWTVAQKMASSDQLDRWIKASNGTLVADQPWPITIDQKNIMLVIAGGEQSGHTYWMQGGNGSSAATDAEIKLPANWNDLLKRAEADIGPAPVF
jgi:hypothetical protein